MRRLRDVTQFRPPRQPTWLAGPTRSDLVSGVAVSQLRCGLVGPALSQAVAVAARGCWNVASETEDLNFSFHVNFEEL